MAVGQIQNVGSSRSSGSGGSADSLTIAIIAVSVLVVVLLTICLCVYCKRRARRRELDDELDATRRDARRRLHMDELDPLPGASPWERNAKEDKKRSALAKLFGKVSSGHEKEKTTSKADRSLLAKRKRERAILRAMRKKIRETETPLHWKVPTDSTSSDTDDEASSDQDGKPQSKWVTKKAHAFDSAGGGLPPPAFREIRLREAAARREERAAMQKKWHQRIRFWRKSRGLDSSDSDTPIGHRILRHGSFPTRANPRGSPPRAPPGIEVAPLDPVEVRRAYRNFRVLEVPPEAGLAMDVLTNNLPKRTRQRMRDSGQLDRPTVNENLLDLYSPSNPLRGSSSPLDARGRSGSAGARGPGDTVQRGMERLFDELGHVELFDASLLNSTASPSPRRSVTFSAHRTQRSEAGACSPALPPDSLTALVGSSQAAEPAPSLDELSVSIRRHPLDKYYQDDLL